MRCVVLLLLGALVLGTPQAALAGSWELPPLLPPSQYGNILIQRNPGKGDRAAVMFSHWSHRVKYTCRVCHTELGFEMKANATEITEERNRRGQYCGACHDGTTAFGHTEDNCNKCHTGSLVSSEEKFRKLAALPAARYGNKIDWTEAARQGLIAPRNSLGAERTSKDLFAEPLTMQPEWANFPPAVFSHEDHNHWLDCSSCHPEVFNIKKKTTKHFTMNFITEGKFCGLCHLRVAFPMNNCRRCHPDLGGKQ